jgi:hypothetical protein
MKTISLVVGTAICLAGCSVNGGTPVTAWGKKDVSMLDYRMDGGQCAVLAATHSTGDNAANSAGGVNGQNSVVPASPGASGSAPSTSGSSTSSTAGGSGTATAGTYRDTPSADYVNRAAMQQRTQEMAAQRARSDNLKTCLAGRGYTEFALTAEQRAELAKLPAGSDARRDYLYKLGTDPDVLARQSMKK